MLDCMPIFKLHRLASQKILIYPVYSISVLMELNKSKNCHKLMSWCLQHYFTETAAWRKCEITGTHRLEPHSGRLTSQGWLQKKNNLKFCIVTISNQLHTEDGSVLRTIQISNRYIPVFYGSFKRTTNTHIKKWSGKEAWVQQKSHWPKL